MPSGPAVEVKGLTVRYGDVTAVDHVDLTAHRGEILGLLGPNGAGKTSVIRALTTIVQPTSGEATVAGHRLTDQRNIRARIGVLPESNGYPHTQTGLSYLTYYGELHGYPRADAHQRAGRLLDRMGLGDNPRRIGTYSRGMRQRLGLARALINDPEVLFLDEPTLGLDPAGQEDILTQLTETAVDGETCVILSSHLLDEVERVCDRVAIMDHARIVAAGTVGEVVSAAPIGGRGRVRVAPDAVGAADTALRTVPTVMSTTVDTSRPGEIDLRLAPGPHPARDVLGALLAAGIEPRSFDLERARLSDAFRSLTGHRAAA